MCITKIVSVDRSTNTCPNKQAQNMHEKKNKALFKYLIQIFARYIFRDFFQILAKPKSLMKWTLSNFNKENYQLIALLIIKLRKFRKTYLIKQKLSQNICVIYMVSCPESLKIQFLEASIYENGHVFRQQKIYHLMFAN